MLFLHEVHTLAGLRSRDFETAVREEWQPILAKTGSARLLWYCHQSHGTGAAYTVVTITAFRDAAAWEELARRVQTGDLQGWMAELDQTRHEVMSKLLLPSPWSPMQEVDLGAGLPTEEHEPSLYMEDTGWPYEGRLDDYVRGLGELYIPMTASSPLIDVQACFQPAFGAGRRREAILFQRLRDQDALLRLLTHEEPPSYPPDSWMTKALSLRDHWESRLLRTAPWSPLW
ncbi:MAG: hypothetical protein ACYDAD_00445 [Acidimicrobiales bacterium]